MISWIEDLRWWLYYERGQRWLSQPPKREWHILLLPGMEPPPSRAGYTQVVTRLSEQQTGLFGGPPTDVHPLYALRQASQQMSSDNPFLRDLFR